MVMTQRERLEIAYNHAKTVNNKERAIELKKEIDALSEKNNYSDCSKCKEYFFDSRGDEYCHFYMSFPEHTNKDIRYTGKVSKDAYGQWLRHYKLKSYLFYHELVKKCEFENKKK